MEKQQTRSFRETLELYLALPVSDRARRDIIAEKGVPPEDITNRMAIAIGLADAAMEGDLKALKLMVELLDSGAAEESGGGQGGIVILPEVLSVSEKAAQGGLDMETVSGMEG